MSGQISNLDELLEYLVNEQLSGRLHKDNLNDYSNELGSFMEKTKIIRIL